jgi:hypothetical protein
MSKTRSMRRRTRPDRETIDRQNLSQRLGRTFIETLIAIDRNRITLGAAGQAPRPAPRATQRAAA